MAAPHPAPRRHLLAARRHDRRRHYRVTISLLGRFMLENQLEFPCQTLNLSPGSIAVTTPLVASVGERVIFYLDQIGRLEGHVSRAFDGGFAMVMESTVHRKDKLAAKLTWLANRHELNLPEDRRHERIQPESTVTLTIILPDGRQHQATLVDVSLSGAAITFPVGPPTGSPLQIGNLRATVVRQLQHGVAVEFSTIQTLPSLKEAGLLEQPISARRLENSSPGRFRLAACAFTPRYRVTGEIKLERQGRLRICRRVAFRMHPLGQECRPVDCARGVLVANDGTPNPLRQGPKKDGVSRKRPLDNHRSTRSGKIETSLRH